MPKNSFAHIELNTGDLGQAKAFYKKLFAWKLDDMPMGPGMTYTLIDPGKGPGGGMQKKPMADAPSSWLPYVTVGDVEEALAKAKKLGAQIVLESTDIGENGTIGVFVDPTGAALGVWAEEKKKKKGKKDKKEKGAKKEKKGKKK